MIELRDGLEVLRTRGELVWMSDEHYFFLNPRLPVEQVRDQLEVLHAGAPLFFERERESFAQGDPASTRGYLFLLTSGTTSQQGSGLKWVVLSKHAFLTSARAVNQVLDADAASFGSFSDASEDRWLLLLPDFHVGGLAIRARAYLKGSSPIVLTQWRVGEFIDAMMKYAVTRVSLVPAQIFDLCQNEVRCPPSVRTVLVGAGALAPSLFERARALGWPIRMTYAMTEACSTIALTPMGSSEFHVLPHWEIRGGEVICLKGESLLSAYILRDSGGAITTFDPKIDGWFKTTDRGLLTGHSLQILGRAGDLIKIGGEKVEMSRLNQILEGIRVRLGWTTDLALIPFPDERLGHVIHLMSDSTLSASQYEQLRAEFDSQVLPFEKIRQWHRVDQIPRTPLGKLMMQDGLRAVAHALRQ